MKTVLNCLLLLGHEDVKPFLKTAARKENIKKSGREKTETRILTSTPEKK